MLLIAGRSAEGDEPSADLVCRGRQLAVVVGEGGPGNGEPGQGEHGEGDVAVPGLIEPHLVMIQGGLVLGGLEALLHGPAGPGDPDKPGERGPPAAYGTGRRPAQTVG